MQVTFVRCLGGLAAIWTVRSLFWPTPGSAPTTYALITFGFAAASAGLIAARPPWTVPSALTLAAACAGQLVAYPASNSPVVLLLWAAVIVAATDQHPRERALLLRVCVTCVYGFTALAKTNSSFLAGDQIYWIAKTRDQMTWSLDVASGPVGALIAATTVVTELFLATGLWFRRTRLVAAAIGVTMHTALIPIAALDGFRSIAFLAVLNYGLVAMYPAFWHPIRPKDRTLSEARGSPGPMRESAPARGGGTLS